MLLNIFANQRLKEHKGDVIQTCLSLSHKWSGYFDKEKVLEIVADNQNYLNAQLDFDEKQLGYYTKKFKEKFEGCTKKKVEDWQELVVDIMVAIVLGDKMPDRPRGFRFDF